MGGKESGRVGMHGVGKKEEQTSPRYFRHTSNKMMQMHYPGFPMPARGRQGDTAMYEARFDVFSALLLKRYRASAALAQAQH
jgi:hypothetical protein